MTTKNNSIFDGSLNRVSVGGYIEPHDASTAYQLAAAQQDFWAQLEQTHKATQANNSALQFLFQILRYECARVIGKLEANA